MEHVRWEQRPQLRRPILIAAFEGWNDAAEAATTATKYLARTWEARRFASIDPEEFYDFTVARPHVRLEDGITRRIDWPANDLSAAAVPGSPHDAVFLTGIEPNVRWRTFCAQITGLAADVGAEMVITLGALLTDRPHSRPVQVIGTAADDALVNRLNLRRSQYEGPTGIVGVLHDALGTAGIPSASLWASVPHYLGQTPSPKAALALVRRAAELLGATLRPVDLEIAAATYDRQVDDIISDNEELQDYVRHLDAGAEDDAAEELSGDELAAEVERFLREQ